MASAMEMLIVHAALVALFLMCCSCMVWGCHACWRMGARSTEPEEEPASQPTVEPASQPTMEPASQATVEPTTQATVEAEGGSPPPPPSRPQTEPSLVRRRHRHVFVTYKGKVVHGWRECGPLRPSGNVRTLTVCPTCGDDAAIMGMWSVGGGCAHGRSNCREIGRSTYTEQRRACRIAGCWSRFAHPGPQDSIHDRLSGGQ